ncbi:MAG TPA: DegT/DnrJ/EryC1/StrS family aminotransferase [Synergistaceae bacterium]|nr:DegT/DnrJ/EryC1/StrS family aminotransferase [Synergistaceae bacterium]
MATRSLPTLDLKRNYRRIREEIAEAMDEVLESQHFILGPAVGAFEKEVQSYLEVPHAIGCASGSDALLLALMALDLREGDEVITTPYSFFATVSSITRLGGRPIFVDIDPETYNLRMDQVLEKISPRTRAILPVHLFGQMAEVELLDPVLREGRLRLVEDCAQSFGAWRRIDGRLARSGSVGSLGCFSFFPTKNLGCYGDGGMISSTDDALATRLRRLRVHGAEETYFHQEVGLNSRLDTLQAAILRVRLRHLEEWNEERRLAAERYRILFEERGLLDALTPPAEDPQNYHIYHQYVIRCSRRDDLQAFLGAEGITSRVYYPLGLHLQPCFRFLGGQEGDYPEAERLSRESLALPIFPEITPEEQEWVVNTIRRFYD